MKILDADPTKHFLPTIQLKRVNKHAKIVQKNTVLNTKRAQDTIREKRHRLSAIFRDPEHFSLKIIDFAASGTKRPFDVVGSVPDLKIIVFCKT